MNVIDKLMRRSEIICGYLVSACAGFGALLMLCRGELFVSGAMVLLGYLGVVLSRLSLKQMHEQEETARSQARRRGWTSRDD